AANVVGAILRAISLEDLPRFEGHGVHACDAPLEPVFADLMVEPGDIARVDGHDPGPLPELAGVEHRCLAQRQHGNIDDRTCLIEAGILEMPDHECIVTLALRADGVADHLACAAELDDGVGIAVVRRYALDVEPSVRIGDLVEMRAQPVPVSLTVLVVDVALIPDPDRIAHALSLRGYMPSPSSSVRLGACGCRGTTCCGAAPSEF